MEVLLDQWAPTPVLTPWNNASGFYDSSKGDLAASAMEKLMAAKQPRFAPLTEAIGQVRGLVEQTGRTDAPKDEEKAAFISLLRTVLSDAAVEWLDAVAVIDDGGARMMPMLGSGGNEGVLDYSGLFLRSIVDTVLGERQRSARLLASVLDGSVASELVNGPAGQFAPGSAGGFNTGPGFESKALPNNPWTFLLMFEGSVVWASGIASRQQGAAAGYRFAVSPFTVRHKAAGHGSAGDNDDDPQRVRGEVWVPIWRRPTALAEIRQFIAEGRVEVRSGPREVKRAVDSLDFADAVASLGVDRGVDAFVRYVFIKRRGESYLALPAGVVGVHHRREVDLVRQLERELVPVDRFLSQFPSEQGPPAQLIGLRRAIDDARFDVAALGGEAAMIRLVRAMGALEMLLARRDPGKEPRLSRPPGGLGGAWADACGDSAEVHLAVALASIAQTGGIGPMRAYLAPLDPKRHDRYAPAARSPVWVGATLADRITSVLQRRMLDARLRPGAGALGIHRNPTYGLCAASLGDLGRFLEGDTVDEVALEELLFGFGWVDLSKGRSAPLPDSDAAPTLPRAYALLKLLFLPSELSIGNVKIALTPDAAIIPLLRAGRVHDAIARATQQLRAKGLHPRRVTEKQPIDAAAGRRLAAALLIPVGHIHSLVRDALLPNYPVEWQPENYPNQESSDVR